MAGRPCREPPLHTSNTVVLLLLLSLLALAPPPVSGWVSRISVPSPLRRLLLCRRTHIAAQTRQRTNHACAAAGPPPLKVARPLYIHAVRDDFPPADFPPRDCTRTEGCTYAAKVWALCPASTHHFLSRAVPNLT